MNKDYAAGNQHGHEDGKTGENHLAMRAAKRLLNIGSYLPGAEARDDQYRKGYLDGFEDEVRTHRVVSEPSASFNTGDTAMSNSNSYAHQIGLLRELQKTLTQFQDRLMEVSAYYQRKVDTLHSEGGLMDETHRDFTDQCLGPTRALIERLVQHIGDNDIPAVQREIAFLEQRP